MEGQRAIAELSGLQLLEEIRTERVAPPPYALLLQMSFDEVEEGRAVFSATPHRDYLNPLGQVHGGVIASLLDSAMGCAVHSALPAGVGYTTVELSVNYVRAVPLEAERIVAEGKVLHLGKRLATAEGRLTLPDGTLLAHATTTIMVLR